MTLPSRRGIAGWALGLALGSIGGLACDMVGLPLPWLLGGLLASAITAITDARPMGLVPVVPTRARNVFIPVIGVSIGSAVTPALFAEARFWWPTLLALVVYVPVAHVTGYAVARRLGGVDRKSAFFGTMPGGFVEAITLAEEARADTALTTVMQLLRLILCIVFIPLGFSLLTGKAVGSAAGEVIGNVPLEASDWMILIAAGAVGATLGRRAGLPAAIMTGPILASGAVHLLGWVEGGPPRWLIDLTQLIMGVTLGARFAGRDLRVLVRAARIVAVTVALVFGLAGAIAWALASAVGETWEAVFLAFSPGGIAEMSLVALSLEISVVYVTAHHILRIVIAVMVTRAGLRRVLHVA